jgi:hypothetical protein
MPPDTHPPPGEPRGGEAALRGAGVEAVRTTVPARSHTERYIAGRERVLGQHYRLHRDPEIAAVQLAEQMGGRTFAHRWAKALLEAAS